MPPKFASMSARAQTIVYLVERLGIATVLVGAILFGLYGLGRTLVSEVGVPLVRSHTAFLESQVNATKRIVESQEKQETFWQAVSDQHDRQATLLANSYEILIEAKTLMAGVPDERREANKLLMELVEMERAKQAGGGNGP